MPSITIGSLQRHIFTQHNIDSKLKNSLKIKRTRTIFILYWFLLTYIIAALVWWFIALSHQNTKMTDYKLSELAANDANYNDRLYEIQDEHRRNTAQYIGEGITFLLLIIVGAVLVFRAVRRQFRQSQQQQNFMMAITHELKTPIAITRLNLETLQKHKLSEEQQSQLITNTLQEAGRLNTLCNNLLLASQIEAGQYDLTIEKVDVTELVTESTNDYITRFPKRKIIFYVNDEIYFIGDRLLLQMAVNNLIDNAIKYSGKEGIIEIYAAEENQKIKISVKDQGNGISNIEKEKIFNKFYRIGNTHTKEARGTGLGLYLTKTIIDQHKGNITVMDNKPTGSIFEIELYNGR